MPEQLYEIIIFYRPVPAENNHLVDLTAPHGDDICIAEGECNDILSLYNHVSNYGWNEAERLKLTPAEEED